MELQLNINIYFLRLTMNIAITCPANATELNIENGSPICTNNMYKYDSSCATHCNSGYSMSSAITFTTCQEDKTWSSHLRDCEG